MRSDERTLLDLLCLAEPMLPELDRIFRFRSGWGDVAESLRMKGLLSFEGLAPSPSALAAYADRHQAPIAASAPALGSGEKSLPSGWWTPAEDARLAAAIAADERLDLVARELGRTKRATSSRARKIGLRRSPEARRARRGGWASAPDWTEEQEARLRQAYGSVPTRELAAELGRTKAAVTSRANALGLVHGSMQTWSEAEKRALRVAFDRGLSLSDVTAAVGREYFAVCKRAEMLGYRFGRRPRLAGPITVAGILELEDPALPLPPMGTRPAGGRRQPEPWSAERRAAWLEALERTGRIDEALTAIGLAPGSRQVAYREKRRDAVFSAAWDEALRRSPFKPGRKPKREPKPATVATPVVRVWDTPERREPFVAALREHGTVTAALAALGLSENSRREFRLARDRDPAFAERCDEAIRAWNDARVALRVRAKRLVPAEPRQRPEPARQAVFAPEAPAARRHRDETIDWEGARRLQKIRRAAQTMRERGRRVTNLKDAGAGAFFIQRAADETEAARIRMSDPLEQARTALQRRGRVVYRMTVHGGRPDRWFVSGLGKDVTDEQLLAEAERIAA